MTATVHLVGAGPGDPDLITVKGRRLIENCDALVYDALVNPAMLDWVKDGCQLIYVGKRSGNHVCPQGQIEDILVGLARSGLEVVRLKGGDPFVFGRGGEEAERLREEHIPFTVVPAVTAALAGAAHIGIPVTHRKHSASVTFISGHEAPGKQESGINWEHHVKSGATLCLYMSIGRLPQIVENLVAAGMSAETPAAVVQWASTSRQRHVVSALESLPFVVVREKIASPAIVIIGDVAQYANTLSWFDPSKQAEWGQQSRPVVKMDASRGGLGLFS